ncbi:MAG TPA: M48 family metalloprotease, partial [Pyrinomonadaceae bacterium]
ARTKEAKKYNTLREFAEDQYASDPEFRDEVDDTFYQVQESHTLEAYQINTTHPKEYVSTDKEGESIKIRRALYDNPRVQEYINRLGQTIVPADSDKLYSFKIIVNPIPTAYTLSTGTVLISTGMVSLLDNEAQLAYILAHELAHVYKDHWRVKVMMPLAEAEYNERQEKKRQRWSMIGGLLAAGVVGAAGGGSNGVRNSFEGGAQVGYLISSAYSKKMSTDWAKAQEDEADDFAMKATLNRSFDVQEVPRLFAAMNEVIRRDSRAQLGFLGARGRLRERTEYSQKLLQGSLQGQYQQLLKEGKLVGTGPEFNMILAELKRDNGIEAFYFDMFEMARKNLQQSVTIRADDPLAVYYYGRVMKQVGRTKEDLDSAQQMLLTAVRLDTRQNIPEIQLHRAMMLMDGKEPTAQGEAVLALKNYILAYQKKNLDVKFEDNSLPPNVDILYDYLRLLGDKKWTAPLPGNSRPYNASGGVMPGTSASMPAVATPASTGTAKPRTTTDTRRRP